MGLMVKNEPFGGLRNRPLDLKIYLWTIQNGRFALFFYCIGGDVDGCLAQRP